MSTDAITEIIESELPHADAFARWLAKSPGRRTVWTSDLEPEELEEMSALSCRFLHPSVGALQLAQALAALLAHAGRLQARLGQHSTVMETAADELERLWSEHDDPDASQKLLLRLRGDLGGCYPGRCRSFLMATSARDTLKAEHDRRVTELLEANNREVERRRAAEHEMEAQAKRHLRNAADTYRRCADDLEAEEAKHKDRVAELEAGQCIVDGGLHRENGVVHCTVGVRALKAERRYAALVEEMCADGRMYRDIIAGCKVRARQLAETLAAAYPHLPTDPEVMPTCTPATVVIASTARELLAKAKDDGLLSGPAEDLVKLAASPAVPPVVNAVIKAVFGDTEPQNHDKPAEITPAELRSILADHLEPLLQRVQMLAKAREFQRSRAIRAEMARKLDRTTLKQIKALADKGLGEMAEALNMEMFTLFEEIAGVADEAMERLEAEPPMVLHIRLDEQQVAELTAAFEGTMSGMPLAVLEPGGRVEPTDQTFPTLEELEELAAAPPLPLEEALGHVVFAALDHPDKVVRQAAARVPLRLDGERWLVALPGLPLTWVPSSVRPVVRTRLNGTVEVADEVEDAPMLTFTGHNGADLEAFSNWLTKLLAQAYGLPAVVEG